MVSADYYSALMTLYSDAFDLRYGVGILRLREGLDHTNISQALAQAVDEGKLNDVTR